MAVRAVIFDWGGTLTPWHSIDLGELWLAVCARHYPAEEAAANAAAVRAAEAELWREGELSHQSATLQRIFERAGVSVSDDLSGDAAFRAGGGDFAGPGDDDG